jgi:hypothetical protein
MPEQSRNPEEKRALKLQDLFLRAPDGSLYKIPRDKLDEYRLSEEVAKDLQAKLTWRAAVIEEGDPFLFKPVELEGEPGRVHAMMPGTGWCACRAKCNCFCGYCSCSS